MSLAKELKKIGVVKKGEFVLTSGKKSDFYIDIKRVLGYPKASKIVCKEFCKIIDKKATCIASIGYGGMPIVSMVSSQLGLPLVVIRGESRKHGLKKLIEGYVPTGKDRVAVVDDVFTVGSSISKVIEILAGTKAEILGGYVVVSRGDISKFKIPIKSLLTIDDLTK